MKRCSMSFVRFCLLVFAAMLCLPSVAPAASPGPPLVDACLRAVELAKSTEQQKAIEQFTICLDQPGLADEVRAGILVDRGNSYNNTGQPDLAITDFSRAIKLDPANSVALNNRGNTLKSRGRHDEALTDFAKALKLAPTNTMIYNNRANTYKAMGQYGRAAADLDKAIELDPSNPITYYNRACLESARKKTAAACDWLTKAINKGFDERELIRADKDLDNIRGTACFEEALKKK